MSLYYNVKLYLEANSKTVSEFEENIRLVNKTGTDFIEEWNVSGLTEPTPEQLASYDSAATVEINNHQIRATRKSAYGDIGDQLDEIYKNIENWRSRIKSIKDANPKETE